MKLSCEKCAQVVGNNEKWVVKIISFVPTSSKTVVRRKNLVKYHHFISSSTTGHWRLSTGPHMPPGFSLVTHYVWQLQSAALPGFDCGVGGAVCSGAPRALPDPLRSRGSLGTSAALIGRRRLIAAADCSREQLPRGRRTKLAECTLQYPIIVEWGAMKCSGCIVRGESNLFACYIVMWCLLKCTGSVREAAEMANVF